MLTISESASLNGIARNSEPPVAANFVEWRLLSRAVDRGRVECLVACVLRHG